MSLNGGVEHFNRQLKDSIQKAQATQRAWKTVVTELLHSYWATLMLQLVGTLSISSEGCQCRLNWTSCLCWWMDSINTSELKWHRHRTKVHSTQYVSTSIYTEYANLSIGKRRDTVQQSIVGTAAMYSQWWEEMECNVFHGQRAQKKHQELIQRMKMSCRHRQSHVQLCKGKDSPQQKTMSWNKSGVIVKLLTVAYTVMLIRQRNKNVSLI